MRKFTVHIWLLMSLLTFYTNKGYSQQEYYIWVDENGVTNYAERAPVGYQPTHVTGKQRFGYKTRPELQRPAQNPNQVIENNPTNTIQPEEAIAEEKTKYKAILAAQSKQNCELGKRNLARLETFARIRVPGEDGEYRYLRPEEIDEKKRESREAILFYCD